MEIHNNALYWSVLGLSCPPLDESVFDFSSPSIPPSVTGFEDLNVNHETSDLFAEWMDEKIDLSILDGLESQLGILDDLDVMDGDTSALLDNLMDFSPELYGSKNDNINAKKCDQFEQSMLQVPSVEFVKIENAAKIESSTSPDISFAGLSPPPVSPGNNVPDISFAVLPESKQQSLYRQASNVKSNIATTTSIPNVNNDEDINPLDYLKVEIDYTEFGSPTGSSSPPQTPLSLVSSIKEYLSTDVCSPSSIEPESCPSSTPPATPISLVPSFEFVKSENAAEIESSTSPQVQHECKSFVLDTSFNCMDNESESHEMLDASVKECKSGNTSLLELKDGENSRLPTKKYRSRKKIVSTSDSPVPLEIRRKERKRVQNKDAATRYREKKRKESQSVGDQEMALEKRNKELHNMADKLCSEISYLKGLLIEARSRSQSRQKMSSNITAHVA